MFVCYFSTYSGKVFKVTFLSLGCFLLLPLLVIILILESPIHPEAFRWAFTSQCFIILKIHIFLFYNYYLFSLFCVSKIELKAELLLWNELWSFIFTVLITVMKSPSFMVICRMTDRYLCFYFDCCRILTIKQVSFENKSWNLFVLQPEGAAVDAGLLGTEP